MKIVTVAAVAMLLCGVGAARFNLRNECPFTVSLWDNSVLEDIPTGATIVREENRAGIMWRHGYDPQATLAELTVDKDGRVWYDISIIPPGTGDCTSYVDCRIVANGRRGFNVALAMIPQSNDNGANCRALYCMDDACPDAYLYPTDNLKVHNCPPSTDFSIVFCPGGNVGATTAPPTAPPAPVTPPPTQPPPTTAAPSVSDENDDDDAAPSDLTPPELTTPQTIPTTPVASTYIRSKFEYRGPQAGNVVGSYRRVMDLATCARQPVTLNRAVGPLSEEVTMVFRGPMEIYNISVFDGSSGIWRRASWYERGGASQNLLFFNNMNVDYSGLNRWGPQIFASTDGRRASSIPTPFRGSLAEASNPELRNRGPGISTGVEVNIMTGRKCRNGEANPCPGFYGDQYSYHGWGGGRKVFVTRVKMPMSSRGPNLPAIWMLNTQVMYAGQYNTCNCRGMGAAGGCGELDVAEVIEDRNPNRDRVSTHHYFYDGSVRNPANGDNFAPRPKAGPTIYATLIDETVPGGLIKIVEIDSFNFALEGLTNALVQRWINA